MYKPTVSIVFGYSGAGKDTIGEYICTKRDATIVKFAAPGKRALEFMLRIPEGSLDNRRFREQVAPHCQGRTYLQVLVDFCVHKASVIGEDLFTQQTMVVIKDVLTSGKDVVITDLRSYDEYKAIVNLAEEVSIRLYWVERRSAKMLASDRVQETIYAKLKQVADSATEIDNNGSLKHLRVTLDKVV